MEENVKSRHGLKWQRRWQVKASGSEEMCLPPLSFLVKFNEGRVGKEGRGEGRK